MTILRFLIIALCISLSANAAIPFYQCERCYLRGSISHCLEKAYQQYHYEIASKERVRIPKIIHQIWLGKPLPKVFLPFIETWKKFHPDWEYRFWTDADIDSFPLVTGNLIHQATNPGQRSDIFRLEILNRFGGLYVDTDFVCFKPHDCFHETADFYAGMENKCIGNALIGAKPKHPIIQDCLARLSRLKSLNTAKIQSTTGPFFLTAVIKNYMPNARDHTIVYPCAYFYPMHCSLRDQIWDFNCNFDALKPHIRPQTHSAHLWAGSWNPVRADKFKDCVQNSGE